MEKSKHKNIRLDNSLDMKKMTRKTFFKHNITGKDLLKSTLKIRISQAQVWLI